MAKAVIGIALGSGAARGWSHIGVLQVLEAEGIKPDIVAGCSIGAFVGAAYAAGRLQRLHEWADALRWREVAGLLDISLNGGGLIGGRQIEQLMGELDIDGDIEDLPLPFASVATDYVNGREAWLQSGPLIQAVRASISLPGIFKPVQIDGDWYVDGGLVNPVPISTCRALGANFIIAVNLNGDLIGHRPGTGARLKEIKSGREVLDKAVAALPKSWSKGVAQAMSEVLKPKPADPGYFEVLANSINIMQDRITRSRLAGEPPHVLLAPRLANMGIFDFDKAEAAIEEGQKTARYALPEIRRQLDTSLHD